MSSPTWVPPWQRSWDHGEWWSGRGGHGQAGCLSGCTGPLHAWGSAEESWAEWAASGEAWQGCTRGEARPHAAGVQEQYAGVANAGQDGIPRQNAGEIDRNSGEDAAYVIRRAASPHHALRVGEWRQDGTVPGLPPQLDQRPLRRGGPAVGRVREEAKAAVSRAVEDPAFHQEAVELVRRCAAGRMWSTLKAAGYGPDGEYPGPAGEDQLLAYDAPAARAMAILEQLEGLRYSLRFQWTAPPPQGLHPATVAALLELHSWTGQPIRKLEIHVDGSSGSGDASWGLVAVAHGRDGFKYFIGVARGPAQLIGTSVLGEREEGLGSSATHNTAELNAGMWAAVAIHKLEFLQAELAEICYDNLLIAGAFQSAVSFRSNVETAALTGLAYQHLVAARLPTLRHVKGHSAHPWNELADVLAKGLCLEVGQTSWPAWTQGLTAADVRQAAVIASMRAVPTWAAPVEGQGSLRIEPPRPGRVPPTAAHATAGVAPAGAAGRPLEVEISIATANVLTLEETGPSVGLRETGKIQRLQRAFDEKGIQIIGIQEARTPDTAVTRMGRYIAVSGGTTRQKNNGCEIWLSLEHPLLVDGKRCRPDEKAVVINEAHPTLLVATIQYGPLRIAVITGQAPPAKHKDRVLKWWAWAKPIITHFAKGKCAVVLLDANARVGPHESGATGPHLAQEPDISGREMMQWCAASGYWVPQTFERYASPGDGVTWRSVQGLTNRGDYLLVPRSWDVADQSAGPVLDVDIASGQVDHLLVVAQVNAKTVATVPLVARRQSVCSAHDLRKPPQRAIAAEVIRSFPALPWDMPAEDHAAAVTAYNAEALRLIAPLRRLKKRQPWITDATMEVIEQRARQRRLLTEKMAEAARQVTRATLAAWAAIRWPWCAQHLLQEEEGAVEEHRDACRDLAVHASWVAKYTTVLRRMARQDKKQSIFATAQRVQDALDSGDTHEAFQVMARLKPFQVRIDQGVHDESGKLTQTTTEARWRWMRYFADLLGGEDTTFLALQRRAFGSARCTFQQLRDNPEGSLDLVPSLGFVTRKHARRSPFKAHGEDGIPNAVYGLDPAATAWQQLPIQQKVALRGEEPMSWRGGNLHPLWKKKGSSLECSNSRDIWLEDAPAKDWHSFLRAPLATHLLAGALESQCGGLGGKGADICLHYGRAHWQYLQASERSGFQAYTDLSAAFASVRRAIAFMPDRSDRAIMSAVGRFIFEPDAYAHLVRILTEPDALQAIGVGPRLRALLQCAHECTWFTMQGLEQPSTTEDGTKAGDPLGDAIFTAVATRVLRAVQDDMQRAGVLMSIPHEAGASSFAAQAHPNGAVVTDGASYLDDCLTMGEAGTPAAAVEKARVVMGILCDQFTLHGLQINLAPGKTEIAFRFAGRFTRKQKRAEILPEQLGFPTRYGHRIVRVVREYRHMGAVSMPEQRLMREARYRLSSAASAFHSLRTGVYASPRICKADKYRILDSLIHARVFYGAESWREPSPAELSALDAGRTKFLRVIEGLHNHPGNPEDHTTATEVWAQAGIHPAEAVIRLRRLAYLHRFHRVAPGALRALVQGAASMPGSWADLVRRDLVWAAEIVPGRLSLDEVQSSTVEEVLLNRSPGQWKALVRHLRSKAPVELPAFTVRRDKYSVSEDRIQCPLCARAFPDAQSCLSHGAREHGLKNQRRNYVLSTHCQCCLKEFWSRERMLHHLKRAERCWLKVQEAIVALPDDIVDELDAAQAHVQRENVAKGLPFRFAAVRSRRLQGPLPAWAANEWAPPQAGEADQGAALLQGDGQAEAPEPAVQAAPPSGESSRSATASCSGADAAGPLPPCEEPAPEVHMLHADPDPPAAFSRIKWDPGHMRYHFTFRLRGENDIHFQTTVRAAGGSWQNAERICHMCYAGFVAGQSKEEVLSYRSELYRQCLLDPLPAWAAGDWAPPRS